MEEPVVIVVELGRTWLAALRTCLRRSRRTLVHPRYVHVTNRSEAFAEIAAAPSAVVLLEATIETAAADVREMDHWRGLFPAACFVAALGADQIAGRSELAFALREAGAIGVLRFPRTTELLLPLLERHWKSTANSETDLVRKWIAPLGGHWMLSCHMPVQLLEWATPSMTSTPLENNHGRHTAH